MALRRIVGATASVHAFASRVVTVSMPAVRPTFFDEGLLSAPTPNILVASSPVCSGRIDRLSTQESLTLGNTSPASITPPMAVRSGRFHGAGFSDVPARMGRGDPFIRTPLTYGHYNGGAAKAIKLATESRFSGHMLTAVKDHKVYRVQFASRKNYKRLRGTGIKVKRSRTIFIDQNDWRNVITHPLVSIEVV
eukprot:TRINITY_DN4395_c0_g1_i1.p1 TRINITY_DN4395_c0_g1~~TRINITY_DN4395_c0_g1_i1.p1  ORF type:complete len:193 (+),score=22.27 TRINITY_DN4395_c0_g1_i1:144-722(+)